MIKSADVSEGTSYPIFDGPQGKAGTTFEIPEGTHPDAIAVHFGACFKALIRHMAYKIAAKRDYSE